MDTIVKKSDWKTQEMPEKNVTYSIKNELNEKQLEKLKHGFLPRDMDHHWFYYYEDGKVYFHRSWTGNCIFIVEIKDDELVVTANRDESQYKVKTVEGDVKTLNLLLYGRVSIDDPMFFMSNR